MYGFKTLIILFNTVHLSAQRYLVPMIRND